jgi:hypothetical protein
LYTVAFSFLDISLKNFSQRLGLDSFMELPEYAVDLFMEEIGISQFLEPTPCNRMISPYFPNHNSWSSSKICLEHNSLFYQYLITHKVKGGR